MTIWRRFARETKAAAAAEMALIVPGIAFILMNVVDLSVYIFVRMQVDLAAHEAVGAARVLCDTTAELPATTNCGGTLTSTMTAAAQSTSLSSSVTLSGMDEKYFCADASGELQEVGTLASPPADCSSVVAGSTSAPGDYIKVTATHTYSPVFPGASIASYLDTAITREAWMRLK